jgi:hypothetical protein
MLLCHALTVNKMLRNNKHTETNKENVPSVINNEIQSTCVPNEKQKEKEDITVVNDDLDTDKYINDNTESDHKVTLSENDHQDLVEIFKNIFSDCSTKMSNLLMSQKMAL